MWMWHKKYIRNTKSRHSSECLKVKRPLCANTLKETPRLLSSNKEGKSADRFLDFLCHSPGMEVGI